MWRPRPKRVRARTGEILLEVFVTERFVGEEAVAELAPREKSGYEVAT